MNVAGNPGVVNPNVKMIYTVYQEIFSGRNFYGLNFRNNIFDNRGSRVLYT